MTYILFFVTFFQSNAGIQISVNNESLHKKSIIVTLEDSLELSHQEKVNWVLYEPILREYDNLSEGTNTIHKIEYRSKLITTEPSYRINLSLPPGTYNVGIAKFPKDSTVSSYYPLHISQKDVIQVTIRENDSYVGFLTELVGLPFVIPPKQLGTLGHQTDLRIGTDCAELAIYGKRRMGFNIPYCGPRGLLEYLELTNELKSGTIIHYGYQVSVLYEDRGKIGILDDEDLLIHAYQDRVTIEELGNTELADKEYRLYIWEY